MNAIDHSKSGASKRGGSRDCQIPLRALCLGVAAFAIQAPSVLAAEDSQRLSNEEKAVVEPYHLNVAGDVGVQGVLDMGALDEGAGPVQQQIINVADPTAPQDAATMNYVNSEIVNAISSIDATDGIHSSSVGGVYTLSADTAYLQSRVSEICTADSSIRVINQDGTVTCEADSDTQYTAGEGIVLSGTEFSMHIPLDVSANTSSSIIRATNDGTGSAINGRGPNNSNWGFLGTNDHGVHGISNVGHAVVGESPAFIGVYGKQTNTGNFGYLGSVDYGAYAENANGTFGYMGSSSYGAYGENANGNSAYLGGESYGMYASHRDGNSGYVAGHFSGVYGSSGTKIGELGYNSLYGVRGRDTTSGNEGYLGGATAAVHGENGASGSVGSLGGLSNAVSGENGAHTTLGTLGNAEHGVSGATSIDFGYGARGIHSGSGNIGGLGLLLHAVYGDANEASSYAGYFVGKVEVTGNLSKGGGSFKIDHPLDPDNRYLQHSFVESPDMMNVYNGNVALDQRGEAEVLLPEWFETLNRDFRYQLTAIGAPGPDLYIAEKISGNRFLIAGGMPGAEVSWQVTGIRQDHWAEANRIEVEVEKSEAEQGHYLHPQLYGKPQSMSVSYLSTAKE